MPAGAIAERPTAVVTGTSREVGPLIAIGLAKKRWNVVGGHRDPRHRKAQEELGRQIEGLGGNFAYVEADLLKPETPNLYADLAREKFGGINAFVSNTAGGYNLSLEQSLEINRDAQLALFGALRPLMRPRSVFAYNQSVPGHLHGHEVIGEIPGGYPPVAEGKMIAGRTFRAMFVGIPPEEVRYAETVGNGLRDALITKMLMRQERDTPDDQKLLTKWVKMTGRKQLPTSQQYADRVVDVVTGDYPPGHTEYVGLRKGLRPFVTIDGNVGLSKIGVETIIPHRKGFLLVDGVREFKPGVEVAAEMVRDMRHPLLKAAEQGHFPEQPIMPGVLITEALAQAGAIGIFSLPEMAGRMGIFREVEGMVFRRMSKPGDKIVLEVGDYESTTKLGVTRGTGRGVARDEAGKILADGRLAFTIAPKPQSAA